MGHFREEIISKINESNLYQKAETDFWTLTLQPMMHYKYFRSINMQAQWASGRQKKGKRILI